MFMELCDENETFVPCSTSSKAVNTVSLAGSFKVFTDNNKTNYYSLLNQDHLKQEESELLLQTRGLYKEKKL